MNTRTSHVEAREPTIAQLRERVWVARLALEKARLEVDRAQRECDSPVTRVLARAVEDEFARAQVAYAKASAELETVTKGRGRP